jgi:C4-dicarboxylate transporter DctQ subunit
VVLYGASLKPSFDYVSFMKVERSSYLKIRMDWMFSIYVIFLVAAIVRYLWLLSRLLRGRDPEAPDPTQVSSGL